MGRPRCSKNSPPHGPRIRCRQNSPNGCARKPDLPPESRAACSLGNSGRVGLLAPSRLATRAFSSIKAAHRSGRARVSHLEMITSHGRLRLTTVAPRRFLRALLAAFALAAMVPDLAAAQVGGGDAAGVPGFWDPRRRPERPDMSRITIIRFLTETDYPPFNYPGTDGNPAGFNVDLARLICEELKVNCTVQMRRFDTLIDALAENRGDAVIASLAVTRDARRRIDFTDPYYRSPARFVVRRDTKIDDVRPEHLEGRKVGVVAHTSHEAYLKAFFTEVEALPYPHAE